MLQKTVKISLMEIEGEVPMKANLVKPNNRLKIYKVDVNEIEVQRQDEWNSFSVSPQKGEKWTQYSFQKEMDEKVTKGT